ncbi:hypothetical protein HJFPF1_10547 [Paramyrothecium foliicola]|nr:hypothetical protein HJFPF1_10547 [Paramyrothecium foliicola]
MPPTHQKNSPALAITLDGDEQHAVFSSGDTIIGHVIRKHQGVSPCARVTIKLCGRAKAKIVRNDSDSRRTYRSRFPLIDEALSCQTLHEGPIHVAPGGDSLSWPFAVVIPTKVSSKLAKMVCASFLPLDGDNVALQTLPPSIEASGGRLGSEMDAFVEYWLEATLKVDGQGEMHGTYDAIRPIALRQYRPGPPMTDLGLKIYYRPSFFTSKRLIPGMEDADVSTRDKMKKLFAPSSVPTLRFQLEIVLPSVIQLEPTASSVEQSLAKPISVLMRLTPLIKDTSEILQGVPHEVKLRSLRFDLESRTVACADGTFQPHTEDTDNEISLITPSHQSFLKSNPVRLLCSPESKLVDVGELINLRANHLGPQGHRPTPLTKIYPSMETYNIRHMHVLKWGVELELAGEDTTVGGSFPIRVVDSYDPRIAQNTSSAPPALGRGDSWVQPPVEQDVPPTFEESQHDAIAVGKA